MSAGNIPNLVGFAHAVMEHWPEWSPDGGDLQEIAIQYGLLIPERRTSFCDQENDCSRCMCAEYFEPEEAALGFLCNRRVDLSGLAVARTNNLTKEST